MVVIKTLLIYRSEVRNFEEIIVQSLGSARLCHLRFSLTLKEKIARKGHFSDDSNEYKFIYVLVG